MILDCQNISKAFGTNVILDNVSFHLEDKEKMAIVGINGAGKTTLLKIIMQEEEADSGQIVLSKDRTIGYLSQHQDIFYDDTVYGVMEVQQDVGNQEAFRGKGNHREADRRSEHWRAKEP